MDKFYDTASSYDLVLRREHAMALAMLKGYNLGLYAFNGKTFFVAEKDDQKLIINNLKGKTAFDNIRQVENILSNNAVKRYSDFEKTLYEEYKAYSKLPSGSAEKKQKLEHVQNVTTFFNTLDLYSEDIDTQVVITAMQAVGANILSGTIPANEFLSEMADAHKLFITQTPLLPGIDVKSNEFLSRYALKTMIDDYNGECDLTLCQDTLDYLSAGGLRDIVEKPNNERELAEAHAFFDMCYEFTVDGDGDEDEDEDDPDSEYPHDPNDDLIDGDDQTINEDDMDDENDYGM